MIALDFSCVNYLVRQLTIMLALPHFCFKSFNAFAQAKFYFGKTQSKTKVFCCPYTASLP